MTGYEGRRQQDGMRQDQKRLRECRPKVGADLWRLVGCEDDDDGLDLLLEVFSTQRCVVVTNLRAEDRGFKRLDGDEDQNEMLACIGVKIGK